MSPWFWPLLFLVGLLAGFVDAIAGGGGLITVPVLLGTGMAPAEALATNKLQATFGSGSAAWHYRRAQLVSLREAWIGILATAVGALFGVLAVTRLDPTLLRRAIPILLLVAAWMVWRRPNLGAAECPPRAGREPFLISVGLVLGFYDGFFGPGTGTFWTLSLIGGLGFELLKATAWTKIMNFTSNLVSLVAFALATRLDWVAGLLMGLGQWCGARLGAKVALRGGAPLVRPIFLVMVLLAASKLFYDGWLK
ncbi:MAG: TSUP family transporter [Verrucomicrobiales bacterium]|nr:TSUP family transporter [Verrucomicrobiales bacterium]